MLVKICGLNPARDVQLCIDLGVDFLGFVFYEKSPRNIRLNEIEKLKSYNKKKSQFVAVTVNPSDEFVKNAVLGKFDYIQLHGSESKERVKKIKSMGIKVIKAIKIKTNSERDALAGSISQNNIENIKKLGVNFCDLSSSLETDTEIGYKDHQKIKKFINTVNELKN